MHWLHSNVDEDETPGYFYPIDIPTRARRHGQKGRGLAVEQKKEEHWDTRQRWERYHDGGEQKFQVKKKKISRGYREGR